MATHSRDVDTIARQVMLSSADSTACPTVLIFDSGVGGLSVYKEIERKLPGIHYIYAFDNIAFPYGDKSEKFIIERVLKIITAVQQQHTLAVVVIACNTASTVSLPALRARFSFPIVGVVPAIKPAVQVTRNGIIGLLATQATVNHAYTLNLIKRFASDCKIELLGSIALVKLAEAKLRGESISLSALKNILHPWLKMPDPPDTIVLGCTHFPLLAQEITQVLPEGIQLIDSGQAIACRTAWLIQSQEDTSLIQRENIAYCMQLNAGVTALMPVLRSYGFPLLHELTI
jgi:glutamate racemase